MFIHLDKKCEDSITDSFSEFGIFKFWLIRRTIFKTLFQSESQQLFSIAEDPWRTVSPRNDSGLSSGTPPVPSLPTKSVDPWAPQSSSSAADEDEFAAISNRMLSNHQNGKMEGTA